MLKSFAEFRKRDLAARIYLVGVRESIHLQFDVLRNELLESVRLPELLFEGNAGANAAYAVARKQDFEQNRRSINGLVNYCQTYFYDTLVEDASTLDPTSAFEADLIRNVQSLVQAFKVKVIGLVAAGRSAADPESGAPAAGSGHAGSGGGAGNTPAAGSGHTGSGGGAARNTAAGPFGPSSPQRPSQSRGGYNPDTDYDPTQIIRHRAGEVPPRDAHGNQPAPYWSVRPHDGFLRGLGRVASGALRGLTRPFRRLYFGHPTRDHVELVNNVFLENVDQIEAAFKEFETQLIQYIRDRVAQFKQAGSTPAGATVTPVASAGSPAAAAAAVPAKARGAAPANVPVTAGPQATPGAQAQARSVDPNVVDPTKTTAVEKQAAAGDPAAKEQVNDHYENLKAACKALGMDVSYTDRWGRAGSPKLAIAKLIIDGKPAEETASTLTKKVFERIFTNIMKRQPTEAQSKTAKLSKRIFPQVSSYLGGLQHGGNNLSTVLEALLKLGAMLRKGAVRPDGTVDPNYASTQAAAPVPTAAARPNAAAPSTAPAATPKGVNVPVTAGPTAGGAKPPAPQDANAFLASFKQNHPAEWAQYLQYQDNDEAEAASAVADWFGRKQRANPEADLLTNIAKVMTDAGVQPPAQPQGRSVAPTAGAPKPELRMPQATTQAEPPKMGTTPAQPAQAVSKSQTFLDGLSQHPEGKQFVPAIKAAIPDKELDAIIGNLDPLSDEAQAVVVDALQKRAGETSPAAPAVEQPKAAAEPERPVEQPKPAAPQAASTPAAAPVEQPKADAQGKIDPSKLRYQPDTDKINALVKSGQITPERAKDLTHGLLALANGGLRAEDGINQQDAMNVAMKALGLTPETLKALVKDTHAKQPTAATASTPAASAAATVKKAARGAAARAAAAAKAHPAPAAAAEPEQSLGEPDMKKIAAFLATPKGQSLGISAAALADRIQDAKTNMTSAQQLKVRGVPWHDMLKPFGEPADQTASAPATTEVPALPAEQEEGSNLTREDGLKFIQTSPKFNAVLRKLSKMLDGVGHGMGEKGVKAVRGHVEPLIRQGKMNVGQAIDYVYDQIDRTKQALDTPDEELGSITPDQAGMQTRSAKDDAAINKSQQTGEEADAAPPDDEDEDMSMDAQAKRMAQARRKARKRKRETVDAAGKVFAERLDAAKGAFLQKLLTERRQRDRLKGYAKVLFS